MFLIWRKRGAFKVARSTSLFAAAIFHVRKSRRLATAGERMKREVDEVLREIGNAGGSCGIEPLRLTVSGISIR